MPHSAPGISQFFWLLLASFVVALLSRRARVPYALALVITGLILGIPRLLPHVHLDPAVLLSVFLPPLLFESAINLRAAALRRDWKPIAIYAGGGTVLSTFIVGGLTAWALHIPIQVALVFGALISTTDPISVVAVFKRLGAGRRLSTLMEAESLFNDTVAVVLFAVIMSALAGNTPTVWHSLGAFLRLGAGGALLGGAIGWLASRVHAELDDPLVEITLTTVVAFGSYGAADILHVSGVMATVVAGLVVGNFGMTTAMSAGTRLAVSAFWEYAAFVVNSVVFLLIGIEVSYVHWADKLGLALAAVVIVLLGRAAIYPLSLVVNRIGGRIPLSWQHVLFWGGLRGALSMALVLSLGHNFPYRETLIAATFGVVLFSLLAQGLTLGPLLRHLGLTGTRANADPLEHTRLRRLRGEKVALEAALAELERLRAMEARPNWSVTLLAQDYQSRLDALEQSLLARQSDAGLRRERETVIARRAALSAEKEALQDAERQGQITRDDWRQIAARIDAELLSLETDR